jgi:hypothetical protein
MVMSGMRTTLRILSYYTLIYIIWAVGIPIFMSTIGDREFSWQMSVASLIILPYVLLSIMILDAKTFKFRRTALWVCSVLALLPFVVWLCIFLIDLSHGLHSADPMAIIAMSLSLPVMAFPILVLVSLVRGLSQALSGSMN